MKPLRDVKGRVRPMTEQDLARVLEWRNHPEVRRYMYTQHEITPEEHAAWFRKAAQDPSRRLLVFEDGAQPQGFVSFQLREPGVALWGFYAAPDAPKGSGRALGRAALDYAFREAGYQKVCGEALVTNERSIGFHLSLGFRQEGVLRGKHFDGQVHHDVVCFGLAGADWPAPP